MLKLSRRLLTKDDSQREFPGFPALLTHKSELLRADFARSLCELPMESRGLRVVIMGY